MRKRSSKSGCIKVRSRKTKRLFLRILSVAAFLSAGTLAFFYLQYSGMIEKRLSGSALAAGSRIYSSPKRICVGENMSLEWLVNYLRAAGYSTEKDKEKAGQIFLNGSTIEIYPSESSYFAGTNSLRVDFARGQVSRLRSLDSGNRLVSAEIEPELITGLFGRSREKRRPINYEEFPKHLLEAVLCAEDKRFFDHPGFDAIRVLGAAWADLRSGEKSQGASTITMQLARSYFFSTKREWRRKLQETYMALILERRFSKEKILELYANEIYLGNRGSFAVHGFGEAAQAYFDKDLRELNLAQHCFLAGIIRAPNRYSSGSRESTRSAEARDRILSLMVETGHISQEEARVARKMPLNLVPETYGAGKEGHFVDMVRSDLADRFSEKELNGQEYRIYTTLDSELQQIAVEAMDRGFILIDDRLEKTYARWRKSGEKSSRPEAALVALNPKTGEIMALVGGRDYTKSQLNHVLAHRQPGSVFKPFVFAAAFENGLVGIEPVLTPMSTVLDEPTTFYFDGDEYTPANYGQDFRGTVTLRDALVHSINIATIKIAREIGYGRVVGLVERFGLDSHINATPAMALGAYELTPLEVAEAYTAFANHGIRCEPVLLKRIMTSNGYLLQDNEFRRRKVLDPKVAYMITDILEDVVNRGTGSSVRSQGCTMPAAGKTGTSRDGWFVGYTTNLLCVVWIGFDDNRELELSGAHSAGTVWAEFMKNAVQLPGFSDAGEFDPPEGIVTVDIDPETGMLATPKCPVIREEVFIAGTEPKKDCSIHRRSTIEKVFTIPWLKRIFK